MNEEDLKLIGMVVGILGGMLSIYRFGIRPKIDAAIKSAQDTALWRAEIDTRLEVLEKKKKNTKKTLEKMNTLIIEGTKSFNETLQMEVRRLEETAGKARQEVYQRIDSKFELLQGILLRDTVAKFSAKD